MKYALVILLIVLAFFYGKGCHNHPDGVPVVPTNKTVLKEVAKQSGVNAKHIKSVTQFTSNTVSNIKAKRKDSTFYFKDNYTEIKGTVDSNEVNINYTTKDTITIAEHTKKKLFGNDVTTIEIKNKNPGVSLTTPTKYEVKTKPKKWSVGVYVGYGFNGKEWQPSVGVSLQRRLFSF